MTTTYQHRSVLLSEAVESLVTDPAGIYVDGTFGRGGHSREILNRLSPEGRLLGFDKDPEAISVAEALEQADGRFAIHHGSFAELSVAAEQRGWSGRVKGVLLDLGVSSPQLDDPLRGFSFMSDGPLDMRMDTTRGESAAEWLAGVSEVELARVLHEYGEERYSRRIAKAIVLYRAGKKIERTAELADVVAKAHPAWERHRHPATRSFQAIRIAVNHELDDLESCLSQAVDVLAPGGRLSVISFHSLEDRIVKHFIRRQSQGEELPRGLPVTVSALNIRMKVVERMLEPSETEVRDNPRARSAKLRVAEKLS